MNIHSGDPAYNTVDSLSAFWPGLQVLAGDIENAIKSHLICMSTQDLRGLRLTVISRLEFMEKEFGLTGGVGY